MSQVRALPIDTLRQALEGSYTIDRELGRGGMSAVFLAQDCKHRRAVAIKVLHPELAASMGAERFLQEIEVAARLSHPHILPLFDSGSLDNLLYYVMPYVEGESLREKLDREQQLSVEEAVHHARAIAAAIDYASRQGIVHRDIKPENVMLYEGEAMVMDFGIAKAASALSTATLTQTGMVIGTPAYVSPEQAAGEVNLDGRSDQYSLACVLYEMLTGERPFNAATPQGMMSKRFTETPRPLRALRAAIPENVERAVARAMALEPAGRFPTAGQFAQALVSTSTSTPSQTVALPAAVSAAKSVAVLPFANMSTDADSEYFTDGMAEEIINALSKIQALRVASRTSSFAFKGKNEDISEIGKKLKVSTVLEGSVRKVPNFLGLCLKALGRHDEAIAVYRKQLRLGEAHLEQHPDDSRACIMAANANANLQDAERSAQYAARAIAMDPDDPMVLYNVACLYGVLGRTDDCLTALEQSVNKGWGDKAWLEHDSDFDSVRNEPRYVALLKAM